MYIIIYSQMSKRSGIIMLVFFTCLIIASTSKFRTPYLMLSRAVDYQAVFEKQVFFTEGAGKFYEYQVYSQNGQIFVQFLHPDLSSHILTFEKQNNLYFRDAYDRFIILQEKKQTQTISYWVLQIVHPAEGHRFDSFQVSSRIDNQGFDFSQSSLLTEIIEYNQLEQFLYVILQRDNDTNIYGIDVANQAEQLIAIGWFFINIDKPEQIIGGNSRVLVEATNDQFLIDTRKQRVNNQDPSVYKQIDIHELTQLPIFRGGSYVYDLIDQFFQYISLSEDWLQMTAFVYYGYGDQQIQGEAYLYSETLIKTFSDQSNFFIAVSDNDIYLTEVQYNQDIQAYSLWSNTLNNTVGDQGLQSEIIADFSTALRIVFHGQKYYILSADNFYVYGTEPTFFTKFYQASLDSQVDQKNIVEILFGQIKKQNNMLKSLELIQQNEAQLFGNQ